MGRKMLKLSVKNDNKIRLPNQLQIHTVEWLHNIRKTRSELTIKQDFTYPKTQKVKNKAHYKCDMHLLTKRNNKHTFCPSSRK